MKQDTPSFREDGVFLLTVPPDAGRARMPELREDVPNLGNKFRTFYELY